MLLRCPRWRVSANRVKVDVQRVDRDGSAMWGEQADGNGHRGSMAASSSRCDRWRVSEHSDRHELSIGPPMRFSLAIVRDVAAVAGTRSAERSSCSDAGAPGCQSRLELSRCGSSRACGLRPGGRIDPLVVMCCRSA